MPRPHIPTHLSLQRIKSHKNDSATNTPPPNSMPSTPQTGSRSGSPTRGYFGSASSAQKNGGDVKTVEQKNAGLVLRVQVLKGRNLAPKDKSGTSDPYLVLTMGDTREATSAVYKTLNPEWNQTFEFPMTSADSALLEVICWDKDRFRKDYMGELDVGLEEVFMGDTATPDPLWFALESRRTVRKKMKKKKRKDENVSGEVQFNFTLYDKANPSATAQQILQKFHRIVDDSTADGEDDDDDALNPTKSRELDDVSEEDDEDDDNDEDEKGQSEADELVRTPGGTIEDVKAMRRRQKKIAKLRRQKKLKAYEFGLMSDIAGVLFLEISRITDLPPEKNSTRTTFDMDPFVVTSLGKKTYRTRVVNHHLNPVYDEKLVFQVMKHEVNYSLNFAVVDRDKFSGNDFVGTTTFPLPQIREVAPEADPETGLYLLRDPEAPTEREAERQLQKKKRWPMSRTTSQNNLARTTSKNDLPKLTRTASSNSLRDGQTTISTPAARPGLKCGDTDGDLDYPIAGNAEKRPVPTSAPSYTSVLPNADSATTSNGPANVDDPDLIAYELPLELKNKYRWQDKHHPVLYIKAKYLSYRALRQQFWRVMLKQYDAEESGKVDKVELVAMLDTLASTLHNSTIEGFFDRWAEENRMNKVARKDGHRVLTMDQAVICLEEQLMKSRETQAQLQRPRFDRGASSRSMLRAPGADSVPSSSPDESPGGGTPYLQGVDSTRYPQQAARLPSDLTKAMSLSTEAIPHFEASESEPGEPEADSAATPASVAIHPQVSRTESWESEAELHDDESKEEHVVEIQECPICHMPRLAGRRGKRSAATDADIITHIATCASSDWRAVNNLVMAGFVTSSQAQRKWYSKVVTKISYGGYRLGANSANILVQDRMTGMINEERMSVYVRIGIRLLYKGLKSRDMETKRSKTLNDVSGALAWISRLSTSAAHSVTSS